MRANLYWCRCGGRIILLDPHSDRYSMLPSRLAPAFEQLACREAPPAGDLAALRRLGLVAPGDTLAASAAPDLPRPSLDLAVQRGSVSWSDVVTAVLREQRARASCALHGLKAFGAFQQVRRADEARPCQSARRLALAHARAARLSGSRDRCLPRALAMLRACRACGIPAALVFGVRVEPFHAHCWVQLGEAVLVGDLEEARRFTPILALA